MDENNDNDYYEILGCSIDSSFDEIKRAYHKLALQYHPDKNEKQSDLKMFQRIEKAARILGDADLRKEYNACRRQIDLENMSILLYARIAPRELETCEEPDIFKYSCRCGGEYRVRKSDVEEENCIVHVPCPECTLTIAVET